MWDYGIGAGMIFWGILFVAFWGGIIALVIWGVRKLTENRSTRGGKSALDIARERYARGEITREQFEQFKKDLT